MARSISSVFALTCALGLSSALIAISGCSCDRFEDPMPPRLDGGPADAGVAPFDANVTPGSDLARALDLLCDAAAYGRCTAPWGCGCGYHGLITGPPPEDVEACVASARGSCDRDLVDQLQYGLEHGWILHADATDQCIAARRRLYDLCLPPPDGTELPRACRDAIITDAAIDAPCVAPNVRCASGDGVCVGGECAALPSSGETCSDLCALGLACVAGRCGEPVPAGGACGDHEDCAAPELCIGGVCGAPVAEGESCSSTARCATGLRCAAGVCAPPPPVCTDGVECGAASFCGSFPENFCAALHSAGEPCIADADCAAGLACVRDPLEVPGACAPVPREGEPCSGLCEGDLRCFFAPDGRRATCRPPLLEGQACGRDTVGSFPCADGLSCVSGTCDAPPREGEQCGDDNLCAEGLVCAGLRTCVALEPEGEPCPLGVECQEGLYCVGGVCAPVAAAGEPCGSCEPGLDCRYEETADDRICAQPGGVGDHCGSECDEGAFCDVYAWSCVPQICRSLFPERY